MKTMAKRIVALCMVFVTLFGTVALTASAATTYANDLPTVYLVGAIERVYNQDGKQVWPVTKSITNILLDNSSELLSAFGSGLMASDWSIYGDALVKAMTKYYDEGTLDNSGNPKYGTSIKKYGAPQVKKSDYGLNDYIFHYDPRLDPWETSYDLALYINSVLKATGKTKVNLIGRCMGACFVSAYLCRYGVSKVDSVIYLASAAMGSTVCGELFSGKLEFDSESIKSYASEYMGDDEISELLSGIVNVTYSLNMLGMGTKFTSDIFEELSVKSFPELLLSTYATLPSYWAMVGTEHYEEAKKFVFGGREKEYAELIKKIDNYHNKVKVPLESKLKQMKDAGLKISVIAKYNVPFIPLLESRSVQGDGKINLSDISFGATGAEFGKTLSIQYLNAAKKKGTTDYISKDYIVDASTCLFPDSTWFIRDIEHGEVPKMLNYLMLHILRSAKQPTVKSFKLYPQFTYYDREQLKLVPVTEPIPETSADSTQEGGLEGFVNLFAAIIKIFKNIISILSK